MEMESTVSTDAQMEMGFILPAYPYPHTMEERAITEIIQNFWVLAILFLLHHKKTKNNPALSEWHTRQRGNLEKMKMFSRRNVALHCLTHPLPESSPIIV
jgi:hypothetical protein